MSFAYVAAGIGVYSAIQGGKAADRADALSAEALAFAREKYADWKLLYGNLEQNLANFYTDLTPEYIESQGLQAQEKQYQVSRQKMTEFFAVNEIDTGTSADLFTKGVLENERNKAQIRADAPLKTMELKQNFLQLGLGQKQGAEAGVSNALNTSAGIAANQADNNYNAAGSAFNAAIDFYQNERDRTEGSRPAPTANQGETAIV